MTLNIKNYILHTTDDGSYVYCRPHYNEFINREGGFKEIKEQKYDVPESIKRRSVIEISKKYETEIVADNMTLLSRKENSGGTHGGHDEHAPPQTPEEPPINSPDGDLPF